MTKEELKDEIRVLIREFGEKETYQEQFKIAKLIWATLLTGNFRESDLYNLHKDMRIWILNFKLYEKDKSKFGSVTLDFQSVLSSAELHQDN
ncbi:MAG: hypothetical protein CMC76_12565 [Flavobacteriaceae bacterium]|nr:hypothetical protein [Flavobacteriaceae bacterium]|tara:strand:- start:234 stop:509 length:276 start_codon:yes stop_codon:yes gene_type:complete